ncbi:c-type cytochrome [Antarctobacter jejuensis]|uniref:c-type cytochrome n=1 Tax=Antarctobacter jejuensis TaxID=1439938 RepID=UPI003FD004DA
MMKKILGATFIAMLPTLAFAESHELPGDADAGEKVFRKCKACHQVGDDAKNRVGPVLNGIVGGPIAAAEGFKYSDAMVAFGAENEAWTPEILDQYLTNPRDYIPGNKMSFAGLRKEEERQNVIAYLAANGEDDAD